jgi:hypothetical protein
MRLLALLSILLAAASGQTSQVPYGPGTDGPGPTFSNQNLSLSFPGSYSSIRKADFRNLKFPSVEASGKPSSSTASTNGDKGDDPDDHYSATLDAIYFLSGSRSSEGALVLYNWTDGGGSSSQGGLARVYTVTGKRLRMVQEIDWDTHFQAGQPTDSFDPRTNTLTIRSAHYIPGDAHCCVSAMDVVTFRWDGNHFVQTRHSDRIIGIWQK